MAPSPRCRREYRTYSGALSYLIGTAGHSRRAEHGTDPGGLYGDNQVNYVRSRHQRELQQQPLSAKPRSPSNYELPGDATPHFGLRLQRLQAG